MIDYDEFKHFDGLDDERERLAYDTDKAMTVTSVRGGGVREGKEHWKGENNRRVRWGGDNPTFPSSLYYLLSHPPLTLNEG
ncbi:hypothetical protein PBY51_010300 [Eleginops maclovinus]|uniref:Uncharacterized protein n=1 Tax=Eleginops maclovinus TaxID=56733 RepID=A0AAN7XAF1_ELEMC|nr:hypothetical protein PBY51_010300 [Eleginops maclovinus]